MANGKSAHILNTSSNLLGFCLIVLTSLKVSRFSEITTIDEVTGIACILLMTSSLLSFLSIRSGKESLSNGYERAADMVFLIALSMVFIITFLIAFSLFL
ncbi:MAG: hypothetical protein V4721_17270 [Bacteroidota bacterium]